MKRIWVRKAGSLEELEEFELEYYADLSRAQRVEIMQYLREINLKIRKGPRDEGGKRLRRVVAIIQQA